MKFFVGNVAEGSLTAVLRQIQASREKFVRIRRLFGFIHMVLFICKVLVPQNMAVIWHL